MREGQAERNMVEDENRYIDRCAGGSIGQDETIKEEPGFEELPPSSCGDCLYRLGCDHRKPNYVCGDYEPGDEAGA